MIANVVVVKSQLVKWPVDLNQIEGHSRAHKDQVPLFPKYPRPHVDVRKCPATTEPTLESVGSSHISSGVFMLILDGSGIRSGCHNGVHRLYMDCTYIPE